MEIYSNLLYKYLKKFDVKIIAYIEEYINNNRIKREDIIFDKENFRKLSIDLNKKCGLTHQEIANEFSVNRLKVTRMINSK